MATGDFCQSVASYTHKVVPRRTARYDPSGAASSWTGALTEDGLAAASREIEALNKANPALARYYRETATLALQLLGKKVGDDKGADEIA